MLIKYNGIKGRKGMFNLGRAALLQGDIGSGKSGLMAAIHFGLSGKVPALRLGTNDAQDPGRLLKIMDDGATVAVGIGKVGIIRTLEATEKKARINLKVRADGKEVEGAEADAVAASLANDLVFADFGRLVNAGDKARAVMLSEYLPQPADSNKRIWAICQAIEHVSAALRGGKETDPKIMDQKPTKDEAGAARSNLHELSNANHCTSWIMDIEKMLLDKKHQTTEDLIETMRLKANLVEKARRDATTAAEQAAMSNAGDIELSHKIPELEEEVNALRTRRDHAQKELERATFDARRRQTARGRIEAAETQLQFIRNQYGDKEAFTQLEQVLAGRKDALAKVQAERPVEPVGQDATGLMRKKQALTDELATLKAQRAALRIEGITMDIAMARKMIEDLAKARPSSPVETGGMQERLIEVGKNLVLVKANGRALREKIAAMTAGTCPYTDKACKTIKTDVKETEAQMAVVGEQVLALAKEQTEIEETMHAAQNRRGEIVAWTEQVEAAKASVERAERGVQATTLDREIAQVMANLAPVGRELDLLLQTNNAYNSVLSEWSARLRHAENEIRMADVNLNNAKVEMSKVPRLLTEIDTAKLELDELGPEQTPQAFDDMVAGHLKAAEDRLREAHTAKARLEVLGGMDIDDIELGSKLWKAAYKGATVGRAGCVQNAVAPIIASIDAVLERMGLPGKFTVSVADGAFTFGLMRGHTYIDVEALSGGEKLLFGAAVLSALPIKSGSRVLTIESAELPPLRLAKLLEGIPIDLFDSVVIASCQTPAYVPARWTVVNLETGTVKEPA